MYKLDFYVSLIIKQNHGCSSQWKRGVILVLLWPSGDLTCSPSSSRWVSSFFLTFEIRMLIIPVCQECSEHKLTIFRLRLSTPSVVKWKMRFRPGNFFFWCLILRWKLRWGPWTPTCTRVQTWITEVFRFTEGYLQLAWDVCVEAEENKPGWHSVLESSSCCFCKLWSIWFGFLCGRKMEDVW